MSTHTTTCHAHVHVDGVLSVACVGLAMWNAMRYVMRAHGTRRPSEVSARPQAVPKRHRDDLLRVRARVRIRARVTVRVRVRFRIS